MNKITAHKLVLNPNYFKKQHFTGLVITFIYQQYKGSAVYVPQFFIRECFGFKGGLIKFFKLGGFLKKNCQIIF